jgi:pimeloyl-ACP methyl ester carboxylesterase
LRQAIDEPETLVNHIQSQVSGAAWHPGAIINVSSFAVALLNGNGCLLAATPQYREVGLDETLFSNKSLAFNEIAFNKFESFGNGLRYAQVESSGSTQLVFLASIDALRDWRLPEAWKSLTAQSTWVAIAPCFRSRHTLQYACDALGLTAAQAKVLIATIQYGNIRSGASKAAVSYQRARALVAQALKVTASQNLPGLIQQIVLLSMGLIPQSVRFDSLVKDIWGLTERQVSLMTLIAAGVRRQSAASAIGISYAAAKKELAVIYETLGVQSSVELSVFLSEHIVLSLLQGSTVRVREFAQLHTEPLQFLRRADGSRIAISDYGPSGATPVLYIHSSMTSRPIARSLHRALAARGFRVISIDRPGYGLSDPVEGHHFRAAAQDLHALINSLGLNQPLAIARGGAQVLLELARIYPRALSAAVVVNPDPRTPGSTTRHGFLGALKEIFSRHPACIALTAKMLSSRLNKTSLGEWLVKSGEGSAVDVEVASRDTVQEDYWRMVRSLATGAVSGYVAEQIELGGHGDEPLSGHSWHWRFILGAHDTLHDPHETQAYWQARVPDASFDWVHDGGRLLSFSHPDYLADQLARIRSKGISAIPPRILTAQGPVAA